MLIQVGLKNSFINVLQKLKTNPIKSRVRSDRSNGPIPYWRLYMYLISMCIEKIWTYQRHFFFWIFFYWDIEHYFETMEKGKLLLLPSLKAEQPINFRDNYKISNRINECVNNILIIGWRKIILFTRILRMKSLLL